MTPVLQVRFYQTTSGNEPVREWLLSLSGADRKAIGVEMKAVQFGWPIGMPLVRKIQTGIWEVRVDLANRIARILFTIRQDEMVLLHGFIKKSQSLPRQELHVTKVRMNEVQR